MADDDPERAGRPASRWMRRATPQEARDLDEFRTQDFLVRFYAVIPLVVVTAFLPAGPLRAIGIALVVAGYTAWGIHHVVRSSRRRRADEEARAAEEEDAGGEPSAADPAG